jgi:hypothetical protein
MGHYASEMMCDTCGWVRCICPPKPDRTGGYFIVLHDYSVMTKAEATKAGMNPLTRAFTPSFATREEAVVAARASVENDLAQAKLRLAYLKAVKVVKPWRVKR